MGHAPAPADVRAVGGNDRDSASASASWPASAPPVRQPVRPVATGHPVLAIATEHLRTEGCRATWQRTEPRCLHATTYSKAAKGHSDVSQALHRRHICEAALSDKQRSATSNAQQQAAFLECHDEAMPRMDPPCSRQVRAVCQPTYLPVPPAPPSCR